MFLLLEMLTQLFTYSLSYINQSLLFLFFLYEIKYFGVLSRNELPSKEANVNILLHLLLV